MDIQQVPVVCIICGGTDDQEALDQSVFIHETICQDCEQGIKKQDGQ